ncbi:MAG: cyclic nucleotide-binding domain-containing protein [Candidatus Saganbacteria bacterium]|nr:cyclic nucleotide-binding domain-containing protein [Candidatus Saganbacteria bacterium]
MPEGLLMFLHMVPIFKNLHYDELTQIASKLKEREFYRGEILAEEGKAGGEALYIIESGHVSVQGKDESKVLATLAKYNFFGEVSLLTGEPHSATIKALTDGKLLVLEKKEFEELENKNSSVALRLNKVLSYKLRNVINGKISPDKKCKFIVVTAALARAGVSIASANLAASIVKQTEARTLLLDLNLVPGSATTILKAVLPEVLSKEYKKKGSIDLSDVQGLSVAHPSGFRILGVEREDAIDLGLLAHLKEMLNEHYDYVVVDVSLRNVPVIEKIFVLADQIVFLVPDTLAEVRHSLEFLDDLVKNNPRIKEKLEVVGICRADELPQKTDGRFDFYLRCERDALDAFLISGEPFTLTHPRSLIAKKVDSLARKVCGCKLGLVLSSGMAQGLAHIGVLKVFEKENISIDLMVGVSGGAIYGSTFAAGLSINKIEGILKRKVKEALWRYVDFTFPYSGFVRGDSLKSLCDSIIGKKTFDELVVPFKVVAADLDTGELVVLDKGRVSEALRASFAIPGIFTPVFREGRFLVDGAEVSPVPVEVLYQSGIDKVVAVNVNNNPRLHAGTNNKSAGKLFNKRFIVDVMMRSRAIGSYRLSELDSSRADLVIRPKLEGVGWSDYSRFTQIIAEGEKAAYEAIPRIKKLIKHGA